MFPYLIMPDTLYCALKAPTELAMFPYLIMLDIVHLVLKGLEPFDLSSKDTVLVVISGSILDTDSSTFLGMTRIIIPEGLSHSTCICVPPKHSVPHPYMYNNTYILYNMYYYV